MRTSIKERFPVMLAGMGKLDSITHFYCETCKKVQPASFSGASNLDRSGKFLGGDIVCSECYYIIATAYQRR